MYWYRFEYQARGSIHCHGVAKIKRLIKPLLVVRVGPGTNPKYGSHWTESLIAKKEKKHGTQKLTRGTTSKNDPGLWKLSEKALKGFLAQKLLDHTKPADFYQYSTKNQKIHDGKKASQEVCQYIDWLMSTYNPDPPDSGTWIKPSIHPGPVKRITRLCRLIKILYKDALTVVQIVVN